MLIRTRSSTKQKHFHSSFETHLTKHLF